MASSGRATMVAAVVAFLLAPSAVAQEQVPQGHTYSPQFMPKGHMYAPGDERLPPIGSPRALFDTQVDIVETEVYRWQYDRRLFETEMHRHDLVPGPLNGPRY